MRASDSRKCLLMATRKKTLPAKKVKLASPSPSHPHPTLSLNCLLRYAAQSLQPPVSVLRREILTPDSGLDCSKALRSAGIPRRVRGVVVGCLARHWGISVLREDWDQRLGGPKPRGRLDCWCGIASRLAIHLFMLMMVPDAWLHEFPKVQRCAFT